jgi:hypothetical protein
MWELTKSFRFEAAHALPGTTLGAASEEIHGHSFRAEVTVRGTRGARTTDAGKYLALHLGPRSAYGADHAGERASRQLRGKLYLLRTKGLG